MPAPMLPATHGLLAPNTLDDVWESLDSTLWSKEDPLPTLQKEEGYTLSPGMHS